MSSLRSSLVIGLAILVAFLSCGCSIGPTSMKADRSGYNMAAHQTENQQLLMNLVRLKYREPVSFLTISSISTQFSYTANANIIAQAQKHNYIFGTGSDSPTLTYSEQPTITYTPLQGAEFANRIMRDISIETFALLAVSDWDITMLIRLLAESVGRVENDPSYVSQKPGEPSSYEKFMTVMRIWGDLQDRGRLDFAMVPDQEEVAAESVPASQVTADSAVSANKAGYVLRRQKDGTYNVVRSGVGMLQLTITYRDEAEANTVDAYLGIKPDRRRLPDGQIHETIKIVPATDLTTKEWDEPTLPVLPIQFRSFLDVMYYVASGIEVPESDIQKNLVKTDLNTEKQPIRMRDSTKSLLDVRCSDQPPKAAFLWMRYRGHYFYIDDSDVASKETFTMIEFIFSLHAGTATSGAPLLTIPIGGRSQ